MNLVNTKLLAFGLGAVTGGIAGALNATYYQAIAPFPDFQFSISITILVMIVLGGIGSIPGVIVGATLLRFLSVYILPRSTTPCIVARSSRLQALRCSFSQHSISIPART